MVRWRGEWTSPCVLCVTLPSLGSHWTIRGNIVTEFRKIAKSEGDLWIWQISGILEKRTDGKCIDAFSFYFWTLSRGPLGVISAVTFKGMLVMLLLQQWNVEFAFSFLDFNLRLLNWQERFSFIIFFFECVHQPSSGYVLITHVTMQMVCLLVVLFAVVVMLGVPGDQKGPHRAHRLAGSQRSHWCKKLPHSLHQNHHTVGHSHKCSQLFHSKYITVIRKKQNKTK